MSREKRCSICREVKSIELFGKDSMKHSKDGYRCRCKICERDLMRLHRRNIAEAEGRELRQFHVDPTYDDTGKCISKRCSGCKQIKSAGEFSPCSGVPTKLNSRCKSCVAAAKRKPEAMNSESHKNSRRNHSLLKKNCTRHHTEDQWKTLLRMTDHHCLYPGCNNTNPTRDHIIPLKAGGNDGIDNIQPLCLSHNGAKQHKLIVDYRPAHVRRWAFAEMSFVYVS